MPRHRHLAAAGLLAAAITVTGCAFLTVAPVRYFEIRPVAVRPIAGPKLPAILVPDFSCLSAYDNLRVVIRKSPVEVMMSRSLQWTSVPGQMLSQGLRTRLEETGRFDAVSRDVKPRPPYAVEATVLAIELSETPSPTARVALRVSVRRGDDGRLIDETVLDETQPATSRDPVDGILALRAVYSQALDGLTGRIIAAIEQDLQRTAPAR